MKPKRNCLTCNKEFELKSNGISHSSRKYCSRDCASRSQLKYKDRTFSASCELCGKITKYSSRENYRRRIRENTKLCNGCSRIGQHRTSAQCKKISKATKVKMKNPIIWSKFMKVMQSKSHREKKRISFSKQIKATGNNVPYNIDACEFFDALNEFMGWCGQHATNGGEMCVGGFWVDYYEPTQNLVIEWDEKHHKYLKKKKQDEYRQKYIIKKLNCEFYRIDEETLIFKRILSI